MSARRVADVSPTCWVLAFLRLFADTTWPTYPTKKVKEKEKEKEKLKVKVKVKV